MYISIETIITAGSLIAALGVIGGMLIAAFIVYLVATGGWEKVAEMWGRTKYNKSK